MRSLLSPAFKKQLSALPDHVQTVARQGFEKWKSDPHAVGWKRLISHKNLYSVDIGLRWRAVGVVSKEHNAVVWMFVGSHESYNAYIKVHRNNTPESLPSSLKERLIARRNPTLPTISSTRGPHGF